MEMNPLLEGTLAAAGIGPAGTAAGSQRQDLQKIARAYSSPPWWYDLRGFFILTFSYRSTLGTQIRFFGRHMSTRHLEVAVGTGTLLGMVLRWRRWKGLPKSQIVGVDYAESMLAGAQRRFAANRNISLLRNDAAALELPDASFESASIANAVHCFPRVDASLREVFRVLKPGACLAANVLLYPRGPRPLRWLAGRIGDWGMRKGILFTPYALEDIRSRIAGVGFEFVEERTAGNTYMVVARKPGQAVERGGTA